MQRMDVESKQTQMQPAAADNARPVTSPQAPDKDERLDFLKQAISFTEWTIRSFDTKPQISISACVLAMNPLWSMLISACPRAASSMLVVVLLGLFLTTVLL